MIEEIRDVATMEGSEGLIAIVITQTESIPTPLGVNFITNREADLQVALIRHENGHKIEAHRHPIHTRTVHRTQEVLVMQKGCLLVDFYTSEGRYLTSRSLNKGDVVILIGGGHGFIAETEVEFTEIKQGPYLGLDDKVRF